MNLKLNLFNYVLALFRAKLLVIQQLETLYLGEFYIRVVCKRMWRIDQVCASKSFSWLTHEWWLAKNVTRVKHVGSWRIRTAGSQRDKKYSLAILLFGDWNSWLIPVASHSPKHLVLQKNNFSHFFSYPTIDTFIPTKCKKLPKRILRDKP